MTPLNFYVLSGYLNYLLFCFWRVGPTSMVLFNGIRAQCGTSIISKHWVLGVQHINLVVMIVNILTPLRNAFFFLLYIILWRLNQPCQ